MKLDTSKGLPLTDKLTPPAAPPPTPGQFRTKIYLSQTKAVFFNKKPTHFYTSMRGDKKYAMP